MSLFIAFNDDDWPGEFKGEATLADLLDGIRRHDSCKRITVRRDMLLQDSIVHFKQHDLDVLLPIRVTFEGEPGVDGGGPRREYFTLLLKSLISPKTSFRLFEGREGRLLPMKNTDALRGKLFKLAGKMIASSILNGGPGFPFLSPPVYEYLLNGLSESLISLVTTDDICDEEIYSTVTKVCIY